MSFEEYEPWSGAVCTWDRIQEENKSDVLEALIDDLYPDGIEETMLIMDTNLRVILGK